MPEELKNRILEYPMSRHIQIKYKKELELWQENGWSVPYPERN